MEINIWGCLWNLDEGPFLMRQRIPDVCVFKGCHLDGWYHSNSSGLLMRRREKASIQDLLEMFAASAAVDIGSSSGKQGPVAILRRPSTAFGDGSAPLDVPHAAVLSMKELNELMEKVQNGTSPADIWSIQTISQPDDGLRVISIYSCGPTGEETSEVFARQFLKMYPMTLHDVTLPSPEEVAVDGCVSVAASRRATVESKTLNSVRFASRFHNLDLEGLVLEFVFTGEGHALLHGCWCCSLFPQEARRRLRGRVCSTPRTASLPRSFPVPTVEPGTGHTPRMVPEQAEDKAHPSAALDLCEAQRSKTESCRAGEGCLVLEVWRGERFLGEALLPRRGRGMQCTEHTLELRVGETSWPSRLDGRKGVGPAEHAAAWGSVTVRLEWADGDGLELLLRLSLLRAQGLPPLQSDAGGPSQSAAAAGPQAFLWQRRWGCSKFLALWTSREAREEDPFIADTPTCQRVMVWDEVVSLSIGSVHQEHPEDDHDAPISPVGHGGSVQVWPQPSPLSEQQSLHHPVPIELITLLKSKDEHVCGAELFTHWGMSEIDGSMRTHILSSQVSQRLSTESRGRMTRSSLLTKMSTQLEQFHDLQLEWEHDLATAKATVERVADEIECRDKEMALIRDDTSIVIKEHEQRLACTCRDMCGTVDDHHFQSQQDEVALEQSQRRVSEQNSMLRHLRERNNGLQESLDKTVRKFDEVSTSYAALQRELSRRRAARKAPPAPHPDLPSALSRAEGLAAEVAREERELRVLKERLHRLHEEVSRERAHSLNLEDFVKRMATAPATKMRTGGGFDMDYTARREAASLIQEMAKG